MALAEADLDVPVELVSVDSMAVYRGMDIGTAKPSRALRERLPFHLIDLVGADQEFTVQEFQQAGRAAMADILSRNHRPLLVGGTGLYLRSLVDDLHFPGRFPEIAAALEDEVDEAGPAGSPEALAVLADLHARLRAVDPLAASRMEPSNGRRIIRALEVTLGEGRPFSSFGPGLERYPPSEVRLLGLRWEDEARDRRIAERFSQWMEEGFLEEVRSLASAPGGLSRTARQALGYRELLSHIEDGVPLEEAVDEAVRRTRAFAKRQMAWFRRDPRIVWVEPEALTIDEVTQRLEEAEAGDVRGG